MAPRVPSGGSVWRYAGRATALVALLGLVAGPSSAAAMRLASDVALDVDLVKPPHSDLRIRWSAMLHEDGGEFLITRQGRGGSSSEVARVRTRGEGHYQVTEPGAAGSWIYRLQYRDRRGRDYLLATIRLNLETVEPGRGALTTAADAQPAAVQRVAVLAMPETGPAWVAAGDTVAAGPARWPSPLPP